MYIKQNRKEKCEAQKMKCTNCKEQVKDTQVNKSLKKTGQVLCTSCFENYKKCEVN